jgi:hypothetical protein
MITYKHAKKYLDKGWSIFPVHIIWNEKEKKFDKKPAVAWKTYQDRQPTEEELHSWFDKPKYNGIGLATGKISRVVVVDVEANATSEDLIGINSAFVVSTISGGKHFYYKWPGHNIGNAAKIEGRPVDFRGDGGYVVLPPSGCNDRQYKWEQTASDLMFLNDFPKELENKLKTKVYTETRTILTNDKFPVLEGIGQRNETAKSVAGRIYQAVPSKHWNTIGWMAFQKWNDKNSQPLEEAELLSVWQSIGRYPQPDKQKYSVLQGNNVMQEFNKLQEIYKKGLSSGLDWLDNYFTFIPQQLYLLSAPTFQGKTTFALNIAARMATLGSKVLFASLEQGLFIANRVKTIIHGDYPKLLNLFLTNDMVSVNELSQAVEETKPDILFIDHLHFMGLKGEGMTEAVDRMIIEVQNMSKNLNIPVFVICHVRKLNADRAPELDDLRNSSSLAQVPSVVMFLYRKKRSIDDLTENDYLENRGTLIIAKNRIQGRTGFIKIELEQSGEFRRKE